MTPHQWQQISELFDQALNCPTDQRAAFLEYAAVSDHEVQERVAAMLVADQRTGLLIDRPAYRAVDSFLPALVEEDNSEALSGNTIGDYRLVRELGRGGMGSVYLAYDTRLERQAALKLLPSRFNSPERVSRLQREARAASALNHPNIITIYDFGHENGRDYIASEYVEGHTLRDVIGKADFTLKQILDVTIQVASALDTAHAAGIIHRDIKPENIMLRPDGYAKVLDFGLAKLTESDFESNKRPGQTTAITSAFETRTGVLVGTVNYMSPEQVRGQKLDGRSDVFNLGVVLYELVTGHRPFRGETFHHTMVAITDAEAPPISRYAHSAPARLQQIISRVLAKDRDQRYQTAREFLTDLETLQADLANGARVDRQLVIVDDSEQTPTLIARSVSIATDNVRSGEQVVTAATSYWRRLAIVLAIIVLVIGGGLTYWRRFGTTPSAFTAKHTVLLADFVNNTGDTDFDGTLKQALTVQLEQSPYLNIYPEERARETLSLMERPRDEKITTELARDISQRRGIKVLIAGTVARLGRNYVITLEAIDSVTGEALANQQTEAESKEEVLKALGRAVTEMREKLGESLASIQQFDVPIEQATTASLEAFKAYVVGIEMKRKGKNAESVTQFRRAIELDGQFAMAYSIMGTAYRDMRNLALGNQYLQRAYELRDRASERERLEISATYFRYITGEMEKRVEATLLVTRTYPQDPYGHHIHGNSLMIAGDFEQAAQSYRNAVRLDPDYSLPRANLALALIALNRFHEAHQVINEAMARGLDFSSFHSRLYVLGFLEHDEQLMQRQVEWFTGRPDEYQIREFQARSFSFAGKWREARKSFAQAAALADARGLHAEKDRILGNEASVAAMFGMTTLAEQQLRFILTSLNQEGVGAEELQTSLIQQLDSQPLSWTFALCGDSSRAQVLADDYRKKFPLDTVNNSVWLPVVRATNELNRQGGSANLAIQLLPPSRQYEETLYFKPTWVRGRAYLQTKNGPLAAVEFQRIIDHRGWDVLSPLSALSYLGLARAAVLEGDVPKARNAYEQFFELWKDADSDLPVLMEAKREYAKLK